MFVQLERILVSLQYNSIFNFTTFLLGITETSPLHQYNLSGDVGDDEVFMVSNTFLSMQLFSGGF